MPELKIIKQPYLLLSMRLFPEIEPYNQEPLDVGDGNKIYWEECGNPEGKHAVIFHGGPGSGSNPWWRRLFDLDKYRKVLFDLHEEPERIYRLYKHRKYVEYAFNVYKNDLDILRKK